MKNESAYANKLTAALKKVLKAHPAEPVEPAEPVTQLVISFLQWNATERQAELAYQRLMQELVDANDLRVSHGNEVIDLLGPRYPLVEERSARLRDALQEVYQREHEMSFKSLADKTKKDVRAYLDSLPGMTQYVAAQVMLLCYSAHAVPVDEKLAELLIEAGAVDPEATPDEIGPFIERRIKAGEAPDAHASLQAWADAGTKRAKITAARTTKKKKTSKKKPVRKKK